MRGTEIGVEREGHIERQSERERYSEKYREKHRGGRERDGEGMERETERGER